MIGARLKPEEVDLRIRLPAVRGTSDGHFRAIYAVAVSKKNDKVAVENISPRVKCKGRVRTKPRVIGALQRRGQRCIDAAPAQAAVGREVASHRKAENLVGSGREGFWTRGADGNVSLALRPAFIRDIDIAAHGDGFARAVAWRRCVLRQILIFCPPGRIVSRNAASPGNGAGKSVPVGSNVDVSNECGPQ